MLINFNLVTTHPRTRSQCPQMLQKVSEAFRTLPPPPQSAPQKQVSRRAAAISSGHKITRKYMIIFIYRSKYEYNFYKWADLYIYVELKQQASFLVQLAFLY